MNTISWTPGQRLVPVAVIENEDHAVPLAEALMAAGLTQIEVTLRTDAALASMERIARECPGMTLGAGTVLDEDILPRLKDIGVTFCVSPGLNERVVEQSLRLGLPIVPGVMTPGEVERGRALGLKLLKFFPAEQAGGAAMLKALGGPYGHTGIRFVPTGGIDAELAVTYWKLPIVAAVGGSWFVKASLLADGDFTKITELTRAALELAEASR